MLTVLTKFEIPVRLLTICNFIWFNSLAYLREKSSITRHNVSIQNIAYVIYLLILGGVVNIYKISFTFVALKEFNLKFHYFQRVIVLAERNIFSNMPEVICIVDNFPVYITERHKDVL